MEAGASADDDGGAVQAPAGKGQEDFFAVDQYPTITFVSTSVTPRGADAFEVAGNLTMRGVTRAIVIPVAYLGKAVEQGPKDAVFAHPLHPYTQVLFASTPSIARARRIRTGTANTEPPSPLDAMTGCAFRARCPRAIARCAEETPAPVTIGAVTVACHRATECR